MSEVGLRLAELDTPVLWVDLDQMEANIKLVAETCRAAGLGWRPHTKGIKTPAIAHKMIAAGAMGVTCAKLGEAEVMAAAGISDILIANQVVGSQKYRRLANLCRSADVKIAVDSTATLAELGAVATDRGVEVGILVELNSGMERGGVQPGAPTLELARAVQATPGLRLDGLMSWEGHTIPIDDPAEKERAIAHSISLLTSSADLCRENGLPIAIVSCGGSGTYRFTTRQPGITEIQAGGAIFCDVMYRKRDAGTTPSLFVRSVVTSRPAPDRILCDAGWKTLPRWIAVPEAQGVSDVVDVRMSAEHGIITLGGPNETVKVGDPLDFMVGYGDTTVCLHDQIYGIRGGVVEAVWDVTGRGKLR